MQIPKTLKIGGHVYDVICPYTFSERGDIDGQHDSENNNIKIDPLDKWTHKEKPESSVATVFLHEILHACDAITGQGMFEGAGGEVRAEGLSETLFQVLRDNDLDFRVP